MKKVIGIAVAVTLSFSLLFVHCVHTRDASAANGGKSGFTAEQLYNAISEAKNPAGLKALYLKVASPAERMEIINRAGNMAMWPSEGEDKSELTGWLESLSESEKDGSSRQVALYNLCELGQQDAQYRLVQDVDKNGLVCSPGFGGVLLSWEFLKEVTQKYPDCYLTRGIIAYEKVRGKSYFLIERGKIKDCPYSWIDDMQYGDDQYNPGREVPGWEQFLKDFPRHPAADDAAYRLARCYEISGHWVDALNTLEKAMKSPDGDIRYHVAGRMVYIPDVCMTAAQLRDIPVGKIDTKMHLLVDYTLAVKALRQDDYRQAAGLLEGFMDRMESEPAVGEISPFKDWVLTWCKKYGFKDAVKKQLEQTRTLAELQDKWAKSKNTADLYNLAAAIYNNQMIYYNHLWEGNRQDFNWLGYVNYQGYAASAADATGAPPEMASFAREMINYNHSADLFKQVYDNPSSSSGLKAKALFSQGLSYLGIYNWGEDAWAAFDRKELKKQIMDTFASFVRQFPDSSMADDALLALAAVSGDRAFLDRMFKDYPEGDALERGRALLEEMSSPYYQRPE